MNDNFFLEESAAPDESNLRAALGNRYSLFESIVAASEGFEKDWKHYGKKYGWKLKAHDGEKALFELTVTSSDIRLSVAARESEMEAMRESPEAAALLDEPLGSGKQKSGWGIRLAVADEASCARAVAIIKAVAKLRQGE